MKSIRTLSSATLLCAALALSACSNLSQQERNTATGAAVGGAIGAVVTGGSTAGTVGGAVIGGVIGHERDKKDRK